MKFPRVKLDSIKANVPYAFVGGPFGSNLTTRDYVEEGVPVIRGSNQSNDSIFHDDDYVFVSDEKAIQLTPNLASPGDVIFTQRGTLGQVGVIPKNAKYDRYVISQSQMKLTVHPEKAEAMYVYYYFRRPDIVQTIINLSQSSGVPHINLGTLKNFEIPLPPVDIQKRIISFLSAYDDLIENNRRRIDLLEQSARMLYKEWFVSLRFPGHEHVKVKDSVPQGWEEVYLAELVETQYGYTESATDEEIGPKFVRGTDINKTSYIDWSTVPYCTEEGLDFEKFALHKGNIVVIRMADPGKVAIIEKDIKAIFASYLVRFQIKQSVPILPYFLFYTLSDEQYQGFIKNASTGATRQSASAKLLVEFRFVLPPLSLQESFNDFISPLRTQMNVLLDQNAALKQARDLLLPRLMNGEISV